MARYIAKPRFIQAHKWDPETPGPVLIKWSDHWSWPGVSMLKVKCERCGNLMSDHGVAQNSLDVKVEQVCPGDYLIEGDTNQIVVAEDFENNYITCDP